MVGWLALGMHDDDDCHEQENEVLRDFYWNDVSSMQI